MMEPNSDPFSKILSRLAASGVIYTIHEHPPSITVQDADTNLWFPVERLVKTVAFRIKDGGFVLAALCGYSQVDYKKLAATLGVNRTKLMRMTPEEIETELGYVLGGVAPFAPNDRTRVVLDEGVLACPTIYCGTGRTDRTLELAPQDLVHIFAASIAMLAKDPDKTPQSEQYEKSC
jgi:Cys-tRNA(Pro)/Cys-tRNA(Cys) deacylase